MYPGMITEWVVLDASGSDDDDVTVTKAAEAGKSHFITFVATSNDNTGSVAGGAVKMTVKDGSGKTYYSGWPSDVDNSPCHINFPYPLKIDDGDSVIIAATMPGSSDDQCEVVMGGFTR